MNAFLNACLGQPTPHTPIWLMRQAGRYQPEYRALRKKLSFLELCKTPEVATEVTLLAQRQLNADAAIIFADILLILEPLGAAFEFTEHAGPCIQQPIRSAADIETLSNSINATESLAFVMQALRLTAKELPAEVALIGFAGAPFTLASYLIEGQSSRHYEATKALMRQDKGVWDLLMGKLVNATIAYLHAQIEAGAQALQLFDSWVGCLSPEDYRQYVQPHMRALFQALPAHVPTLHFATGNTSLYPLMKAAGGHVIGLDWRVDLDQAWQQLGYENTAVMGNLDPTLLSAPPETMIAEATRILDSANARPGHIFNLGHGVMPSAKPDQVRALVDFVHRYSAQQRQG